MGNKDENKEEKIAKSTALEISDTIKKKMNELAKNAAQQTVMNLWNEYYAAAVDAKIHELLGLFQEADNNIQEANSNDKQAEVAPKEKVPQGDSSANLTASNSLSQASREFDAIFMTIIRDFTRAIISRAGQSTEFILELSGSFLNESVHKALTDFYDLYFSKERTELDEASEQINSEIDKMVQQVRTMLESGTDLNVDQLAEAEQAKRERLSLSALQKKLETIISLDESIKETLVPVLSGMQFEDLIKHRISNIASMWKVVTDASDKEGNVDVEKLGEELAGLCSSQAEQALYYKTVLKREAPEGAASDRQNLTNIFF